MTTADDRQPSNVVVISDRRDDRRVNYTQLLIEPAEHGLTVGIRVRTQYGSLTYRVELDDLACIDLIDAAEDLYNGGDGARSVTDVCPCGCHICLNPAGCEKAAR